MTVHERRVLEDGRDRLRGVLRALTDGGKNPISPLVRRAESPALWSGAWQANGAGFLQATEWWVGKRLGDAVDAVVGWLDRRITQLDDHGRALAAGGATTPPPAPLMPPGGPGPPPAPPRSWRGSGGFSAMDSAEVKRLCHDMATTADGIAQLGRAVRAALEDMAAFVPTHAAAVAGADRFDEVSRCLREVGQDLSGRATRMEEAYVVSAFFGAPLPMFGKVAAAAPARTASGSTPPVTPAPTVAPAPRPTSRPAGAARPPDGVSRSHIAGFFLGRLARGGIDGDERRRALRTLKAACARARRDSHSAADFVNGLGAEALGRLVGTNDEIRKELGCVLGMASCTGQVKFDARAVMFGAGKRLHHTDMLDMFEAGRFDPSWVIAFAEQFFSVPAPRPTKYYFDMVERTVRLLGRDRATARAAATDPEIARSLGGLINHVDKGVRQAAELVVRRGLLPPPANHDQLVAARDAMETIILRACEHPRPTGAARRLVGEFLAVNMGDLANLTSYRANSGGRLSADELSLTRTEYQKALAFAVKDRAGRAVVLAASTAELAAIAGSGAITIATGLTAGIDLEGVKGLARSAASQMADPLRELGGNLGMLGEVNLEVLDDRKRAAKEIATAIGVVGSIVLAGAGMAAGAAGGTLEGANTLVGAPVGSEVVTQLTEALEKRLVAADVTTASDFMETIDSTIETVMVVALYNQTDANGGHPFRGRMFAMEMRPPPDQFLDEEGNLALPVPLSPEAQGRLDEWLHPSKGSNPLYEVSHAWVHTDGGLSDTLETTLVKDLYNRGLKE